MHAKHLIILEKSHEVAYLIAKEKKDIPSEKHSSNLLPLQSVKLWMETV